MSELMYDVHDGCMDRSKTTDGEYTNPSIFQAKTTRAQLSQAHCEAIEQRRVPILQCNDALTWEKRLTCAVVSRPLKTFRNFNTQLS